MDIIKNIFIIIVIFFAFTGCSSGKVETMQLDSNEPLGPDNSISDSIKLREKLIIGTIESPPFTTIVDGKLEGPYIDIVTDVLDNMGYEYQFKILPWNRVVESIENGAIDIGFAFYDSPVRRKFASYIEEPLGFSEISLFTLPNSDIKFDGSLTSIDKYTIGTVQNFFYSSEFEDSISNNLLTVDEATDSETNIRKLINGRVNLIMEDSTIVNEYIKLNASDIELKKLDIPLTLNYSYIVFPRKNNYDSIRSDFNSQIKLMKSNGSFYKYFENYDLKYFSDNFRAVEISNPPPKKYFIEYKSDPISVGVLSNTTPYVYYENKVLTGFIIDYLSEIFDRMGLEYEFIDIPFSRMLKELENGSLDIGADIYFRDERDKYLLYPTDAFTSYSAVIFKKIKTKLEFTGDINELKPYSIGYIRDYSLGPLDPYKNSSDYKLFESNTNQQNFDYLINDRVELIIDIKSTGENMIEKMNLLNQIESVDPPIFTEYSYIVFSKKNNLESLVSEYEDTINSMREDNTLEKLYEKYKLPFFQPNK